jgi:hypothetical protein
MVYGLLNWATKISEIVRVSPSTFFPSSFPQKFGQKFDLLDGNISKYCRF